MSRSPCRVAPRARKARAGGLADLGDVGVVDHLLFAKLGEQRDRHRSARQVAELTRAGAADALSVRPCRPARCRGPCWPRRYAWPAGVCAPNGFRNGPVAGLPVTRRRRVAPRQPRYAVAQRLSRWIAVQEFVFDLGIRPQHGRLVVPTAAAAFEYRAPRAACCSPARLDASRAPSCASRPRSAAVVFSAGLVIGVMPLPG